MRSKGGGGKSKSLTPLLGTVNFPPVQITNSKMRQPTRQIKSCVMMYVGGNGLGQEERKREYS